MVVGVAIGVAGAMLLLPLFRRLTLPEPSLYHSACSPERA